LTTSSFPQPTDRRDRLLFVLCAISTLVVVALLLLLTVSTVLKAVPALPSLTQALTETNWAPLSGQFGMLAMIVGSLTVSLLALSLAAPLALILAAWLALYSPPLLRAPLRTLYELMAGIPSVVYGLWGLILLVPLVNQLAPPGASLLSAAIVVALMILPYGVLLIDSRLQSVPLTARQAALAAGLPRFAMFRAVYWPMTRDGAVKAMVLQFGRAIGETMAVLMVAGNVVALPDSVLAPVRTLTANIALEMGYADDGHRAMLYLSGVLLLLVAMLTMALVRRNP